MKNAFIISGVFISGLIGSGFATGSEIYFYFSRYANKGYLGIVLSSFLFALLQYEIITQSHRLSAHTIDEYLSKIMPKGLAAITGVFTYVFMLFILSAMLSGFGEMLYYLWGIKKSAGALIMLLVTAFIISKGYNIFIKSESIFFVMIILIMAGVFAYLYYSFTPEIQAFSAADSWELSAVSYTGYNMLTGAAVLCMLSKSAEKKTTLAASAVTFSILTVIMCAAGGTILMYSKTLSYVSMPIVEICKSCSAPLSAIYSAAVFLSMLTTAISTGYPLKEFICTVPPLKRYSCIMYAAAYLISGMQFSFIVDKLYRISGIISIIFLFFILKEKFINKLIS